MNYQPPVHPAFRTVDRQETSTTLNNKDANMCPSRPSSPPALPLQHGSIDMSIDPIPLFPAFIGNDDSTSTIQSDAADHESHPLLTKNYGSSRKMDHIDNDDDGRAAFSAAATDIGGSNAAKGHKRGDTFEPLPFRTSEDVRGYRQPYAGQQIQMQVYPAYHQEPKKFDPTSPARMQPPIVSHAHTEDQMHADHSNKGHRKVPSFVTPLRGYDDAMIEDGNAAPRHHAYGYQHNYHGQHGYYPPYHLWQHQYGGAGHVHHQQPPIPHPPPAPPIFHPLANDTGIPTSKHTIKRRYFQENRHGGAFSTPVPAPVAAPAYHRPPLPSHGSIHHYNEQNSDNHHGKAAHRRGPSIIFDNDEDWHQQSPTVLYRSWSTGGSSTTTTTANVRDDSDACLRAPKKRTKKKAVIKKKRKSKSMFTTLSADDMPPLPTLHTTNNDNIVINETNGNESDDDVMVSDLDMDLPLESLVNFQKTMNSSETTQKALEKWDKKMGLKRSHSKTMWDSDRSRQKLQNAVLGIQRAKLRLMRASTPSTSPMLENAVANEVDVAESSYQSPTFNIRTPQAQTDAITTLSEAKQNSKGAESGSDSSILSESRDASNQSFVVSSPQKTVDTDDQPVSAFILGSPATGANHTKMASASDILPLSPAQPSPPRANLTPKWAFKEV